MKIDLYHQQFNQGEGSEPDTVPYFMEGQPVRKGTPRAAELSQWHGFLSF
jgi:hypothetical protein